jgi:hypothetical protein
MKTLQKMLYGIEYTRHIPQEAEDYAIKHNLIVIVPGSDDLFYAYGADCYLTQQVEFDCWDGTDFEDADNDLKNEVKKYNLKVLWCGRIDDTIFIKDYSILEKGAFSYQVDVKHKHFPIMEEKNVILLDNKTVIDNGVERELKSGDIYGTGIIFKVIK